MGAETLSPIEILTENITKKIDDLEKKSNGLLIIKQVQLSQQRINKGLNKQLEDEDNIPQIQLDVAYDKKNDKYYIISNKNYLNIALNKEEIILLLEDLEKLFLAKGAYFGDKINTINLIGGEDFRAIQSKSSFSNRGKTIYYKGQNALEKLDKLRELNNPTEEIFKFIMLTKGIPIEEWDIEGVCIGEKNEECKKRLGTGKNPDIESILEK